MTTQERQALELIADFGDMGLDYDKALLASIKVVEARYSEAIVHSTESSRVDHWDNVLDVLNKL